MEPSNETTSCFSVKDEAITWLSEKQVAQITGLSVSFLQKQRFRRIGLNYYKIGRAIKYSLDDVKSYMASNYVDLSQK